MQLITYNGEYFERSTVRYVIFFLIVGAVMIGSILSSNMIGAVIVLIFVGGYFFFLTKTNEVISLKIEENGLMAGKKFHPRNTLSGFVLEYHTKKQTIHNIVLLHTKGYEIFTINDSDEHLKDFLTKISSFLPLIDKYEQGFWERFIRIIKL
jgi:hypothetical protein